MKKIAIFIVFWLAPAFASAAQVYEIQVTRKSQDLYGIEGAGKMVYIKTAYCYEFATWGKAVLILNNQPFSGSIAIGKIIFIGSGTSCQVDTLLQ